MSTAWEQLEAQLWPNLRLTWFGALDHAVGQYDRGWLLSFADHPDLRRGPLRQVSELLKQLADNKAAIRELNDGANRQTAPQRVRGLNVIVHYLAVKELGIKGREGQPARQYVAEAWNISDGHVKDLNTDYATDAAVELERLIETQRDAERTTVLERIEADMRVRARFPWMRF